jgi:Tol biopolymer transport system component
MNSYRELRPGQRSQIWIGGPTMRTPTLLLETDKILLEAPNWSLDGHFLYVNGNGTLWALDIDAADNDDLRQVRFDGLPEINNDHVLSPDGKSVYMSAIDGQIYKGALAGGPVERITAENDVWHFLHGVSPDGGELAWVEMSDFSEPGRLVIGSSASGGLSRTIDTGSGHIDGPEWSPDGRWIYFNTESFTSEPGHAQLARIKANGGFPELLVKSSSVDWFPHLSPDGRFATYVSFPSGTRGHPADLDVRVNVVSTDDWPTSIESYALFGGQGTMNVNSWSPASDRFAFVAYPLHGVQG